MANNLISNDEIEKKINFIRKTLSNEIWVNLC